VRGNGKQYLNLSKLYNNEGTGYCQTLALKNRQAYKRGYEEIARRRALFNKTKKGKKVKNGKPFYEPALDTSPGFSVNGKE
jgi:hypothetical protein